MKNEFKLKLSFTSLVSMSALIGFCAGAVSIPLIILQKMGAPEGMGVLTLIIIFFASPILGAINGVILGTLGYPLYSWLTKKISFKYKGEVYQAE